MLNWLDWHSVAFGWTDVADIAATSVLVYYFLLLVRGTRAVQIMSGLLVLVVVLAFSNLLHLLVLATVMQFLLLGIAVTLPVVFQPELRRALEQLGRGDFLRRREVTASSEVVNEAIAVIARSAFLFSRNRVGALIVIEQATGLKEFVESGTTLDAKLSLELLSTIFTPNTPLHDGAVIVRGGVIEAAGCFLPLSENIMAERHLGTRHRAAVGLAEQTDAVVVVVSEQTGFISIARAGRLSVEIDDEERLTKILVACIRGARPRREARERRTANVATAHAADRPEKLRA
jgi:diadenylate cyclase